MKKISFHAVLLDILPKIVLDEFLEIDMKLVQNPEAAVRKCSTK